MSEKAGEIAREGADYRCAHCHYVSTLLRGALIPACPHCGHDTYDLANPRFETVDDAPNPRPIGPRAPG